MAARVLLLSAPVGESHLVMARALARDVEQRDPTVSVTVHNSFDVLGRPLGRLLQRGYTFHLDEVTWSYNLAYRLFTRVRVASSAGELALYALGGSALADVVAADRPDVAVSTHPVISAVLSRLRAAGRVRCPVALVVGPLGGLGFWLHPAADMLLLNYIEALPDVERQVGPGKAVAVRPLVDEEFFTAPSHAAARAELGIPDGRGLVLISGGGWGAGDVEGAITAARAAGDTQVIAVAGRNEPLRQSLARRHRDDPRVRVIGFTDQMRELLAAADVFVTATAGLSCLEAELCGCPTVWYGFPAAHVRDNVSALVDRGLARAAETPAQLAGEISAALSAGRGALPPPLRDLPRGADVLLELPAEGTRPTAVGSG